MILMTAIAKHFAGEDWILRSGGANGADTAFENGADRREIFLPWKKFNGNKSPLFPPSDEAIALAEQFHPAWHMCTRPARLLLGRNCHQILGKDLNTPVKMVVCWTWDGKDSGGTGLAMRVAKSRGIPIYNLHNEKHRNYFRELLP